MDIWMDGWMDRTVKGVRKNSERGIRFISLQTQQIETPSITNDIHTDFNPCQILFNHFHFYF